MIGIDCLPRQPRHIDERPQSDLVRTTSEQVQTDLGNHAVLAHERHDIGERTDGGDLHEPGQPPFPLRPRPERLHQLERHADSREVLVRIATVAALGVDDGQRFWQLGVRLVMVGDDQVDAQLGCPPCGLVFTNPAVDRDDERHALGVQPFEPGRLQAIAVAALGNVVHDARAEQFERAPQDDGRRHAVHVVIAVDRNPLLPRDRAHDAIDRDPHVGKRHRIVQMIERRMQEPERLLRIAQTTLAQQARHRWLDLQRRRQRPCGRLVSGLQLPPWRDHP